MNAIEQTLLHDSKTIDNRFRSIAQGIGWTVAVVGCLVLLGWVFDIPNLKSIVPGWSTMKSTSAVLYILSGVCLSMRARGQGGPAARILAAVVAVLSLLTLGEYLLNRDFGIDQILFVDPDPNSLTPGRMSPATALAFFLTSLALLFLDRGEQRLFTEFSPLIAFAISLLALIGYLYGVSSLYKIGQFSSMALHTALNMLLLALGIVFARPDRGLLQMVLQDTAGGYVLRRFLPAAFLVPIGLGTIQLLGERAGLYDTAFGFALMVILLITTLAVFGWLSAGQLTAMDRKRQVADESSRSSDLRFHRALQSLTEGCQIIDYNWRYLYLNDSAVEHSQMPREQMIGRTVMECFPGIEDRALFTALKRCMQERSSADLVDTLTYSDGSRHWFEFRIEPSPDGLFVLSSDVTRRKQAEQALLEREMQLSRLFEILPVGISILDARRQVTYSNSALKKILHLSEDALRNGTVAQRTYIKPDGTPMDSEELASAQAFRTNHEIDDLETGIVIEDGSTVWTSISAVPVNISDWKVVLVTADITARKHAEQEIRKLNLELEQKVARRTAELATANEQLHQLAILDDLTGLYNRRGFLLLAEEQILLAKRTGQNLVVFYGDLDGLKQINDRGGHAAGDRALITAARALTTTFRASDVKARLSGDEFVVLAIHCCEPDAATLLERLDRQLMQQNLSMSVGITTIEIDEDVALPDLMIRADQAMYKVKSNRRGRHNT